VEDLKDLLFDLTVAGFMDPSVSFEDMEDLILEDNVDDSKEIEEIFFDGIEPVSKLDILVDLFWM